MGRGDDDDGLAGMVPGVQQSGVGSGKSNGVGVGVGVGVGAGAASTEKKLRKRRELDAMVAKTRMMSKHRNNGLASLGSRGSGKTSSQELLADYAERGDGGGGDDDNDDDDDELMNVSIRNGGDLIRGEEDDDETESSELGFAGLQRRGGGGGKKQNITASSAGARKKGLLRKQPRSSLRSGAAVLCRTCSGLWLVATVVGMCFMVVFAVLGLHVQMKMEVDTFRVELDKGVRDVSMHLKQRTS